MNGTNYGIFVVPNYQAGISPPNLTRAGRRPNQGSGKLLRLLRILVDKSKSRGQFWSETTRNASGQIVSGQ